MKNKLCKPIACGLLTMALLVSGYVSDADSLGFSGLVSDVASHGFSGLVSDVASHGFSELVAKADSILGSDINSDNRITLFPKTVTTYADKKSDDVITLRVCNWEEYIDTGDWDEDEKIELDNGTTIFGENDLTVDFENWYYETTGQKVKVEYSCFGTNEDLYNQLTLGDTYDLVCPSEYMIMKLISEGKALPFSDDFFKKENEQNYYVNNVSPFIKNVFETNEINGEAWSKYAAGYMWGVTGTLYNPDEVDEEDVKTMDFYRNKKYASRITLKDNVRDSYFVALGALYADKLMDKSFVESADYEEQLAKYMNDTSPDTIDKAEEILHEMVDNSYSLETDSGKADMVSRKVVANYQWSGDAVYAMDQAEEDELYLDFAVPQECTNMWFDGWIMMKSGINGDERKQKAAESFVNFLSRPDNAVRNMYYIGYTSSIAGNENDDTVFQYLKWCYADEEGDVEYPVGYFFSGDNDDDKYIVKTTKEQTKRQLFAQYPTEDVMKRSAVMQYFNQEENKNINQMWINIRCFNIEKTPVYVWIIIAVAVVGVIIVVLKNKSGNVYKKM